MKKQLCGTLLLATLTSNSFAVVPGLGTVFSLAAPLGGVSGITSLADPLGGISGLAATGTSLTSQLPIDGLSVIDVSFISSALPINDVLSALGSGAIMGNDVLEGLTTGSGGGLPGLPDLGGLASLDTGFGLDALFDAGMLPGLDVIPVDFLALVPLP
ncbi:hypothetical protein NCG89_04020 [Spongiibacter taiwanensis]|uniref:hypothetical protein n=1 Tax=Spongiibacter taiwanensis TaxID=1748242 RepID=UPI00203592D3|nr:hypothetical protein [Spongiibacter taiwanensis]USA43959.1 hypothetical protein NCG89_04020 [Spongiibacter taiwanensis]